MEHEGKLKQMRRVGISICCWAIEAPTSMSGSLPWHHLCSMNVLYKYYMSRLDRPSVPLQLHRYSLLLRLKQKCQALSPMMMSEACERGECSIPQCGRSSFPCVSMSQWNVLPTELTLCTDPHTSSCSSKHLPSKQSCTSWIQALLDVLFPPFC